MARRVSELSVLNPCAMDPIGWVPSRREVAWQIFERRQYHPAKGPGSIDALRSEKVGETKEIEIVDGTIPVQVV